jgi:hypothetical protein
VSNWCGGAHELHPEWADYLDRTENTWTIRLDSMAKALDESF